MRIALTQQPKPGGHGGRERIKKKKKKTPLSHYIWDLDQRSLPVSSLANQSPSGGLRAEEQMMKNTFWIQNNLCIYSMGPPTDFCLWQTLRGLISSGQR